MTDISKHPLLKQAYDVCLAIEACGASVELTNAVIKASQLLQDLGKFIDAQAPDAPAVIPATAGAEVIVHIETAPGLTVEKLEDLSTLEAYFVRAAASGVIDFTVRCTHHQEGEGAHFYIHPANISGETLQFVVAENTLRNV